MDEENAAPIEKDASDISLLDLALVLAENLRLLIIVPLAAGLVVLGIGYLITPTFTATTRILPPLQQQSGSAVIAAQLGALAGLGSAGIKNPADQYIAFLRSGPVLDAMIERFKLKAHSKTGYTTDARKSLEGRTKITAGMKDGIISIAVDDDDPKTAADIANAYVDELRNLLKTLAVTEPAQRRLFYETQLKQTQDNLTKAEIALRASGISVGTLKTVPGSALEALARIRAQITMQEIKLASMRTSMTDSNPALQVALQELAALRMELSKTEQSNTAKAGGDGAEYIAKLRDFKYHETLFDLISKQYEVARLDEAREGAVVQVLELAIPPERKSRPSKAVNAVLATLVMFFALVIFVFIRHTFRNMASESETGEKLRRLRQLISFRRA